MDVFLRKDEAVPLPDQISSILRYKIMHGEFHPGKKLGTIRQFAKDFEVSPVTVIKALDILEEETLIKRVPVKGIFVSEKLSLCKKQLNGCLVFPEKYLSSMSNSTENWALNYEMYRGLFEGGRKRRINMQFIYFEDHPSPETLERQKMALHQFDFAVFPCSTQLHDLCRESAKERLTFCFGPDGREDGGIVNVDYNRANVTDALMDYLRKSSCASVGVISHSQYNSSRASDFLKAAAESGFAVPEGAHLILDPKEGNMEEKIREYLRAGKCEFIFVNFTEIMPLVYEGAYQIGLTVGKDFIPTAVASGITFAGLFPRLSYYRIPRYEAGLQVMDVAEKTLRSGKIHCEKIVFKLEFVKGHCYKISKCV